jgi:hypothetical protein
MSRSAVVPQCPNCQKYDVLVMLNKESFMKKVPDSSCSCGGFSIDCECGEQFHFCNGYMQRSWGMGCPESNGKRVSEEYCKQFM